jgi:hypothetical protein
MWIRDMGCHSRTMYCAADVCLCVLFWRLPREQYIRWLTEEHMGHMATARGGASWPVYSSVTCNWQIYEHIFIGYTSPMNIPLHSLVTMNIFYYICRRCISQGFCRLTDKFTLNSSVQTDEYFIVSCLTRRLYNHCHYRWQELWRFLLLLCRKKFLFFNLLNQDKI